MVRHSRILLSALAVILALSSCGSEEPIAEEVFKVASNLVEIDAFGGQENILLTSTKDWTASSSQSWVKVASVSGKGSQSEVRIPITIGENDSPEDRSATVTIKNLKLESLTVTVRQSKNNGTIPAERGIKSAEEFVAFANAVNSGGSISPYMTGGVVVLQADIDMSGVTEWTPIGSKENPFSGEFDAKGFKITGCGWSCDLSKTADNGLFGYVKNAKIRGVVLGNTGETIEVKGTNTAVATAGGIVGYACQNSEISGCTNNVSLKLSGDNAAGLQLSIAGVCGSAYEGVKISSCENNGDVSTGRITNTENGKNGLQVGGVCGFVSSTSVKPEISGCVNTGHISAPTGRGGGIAASLDRGVMTSCTNKGLVEDDIVGQFTGDASAYAYKRMGGLTGMTGTASEVKNCENEGNVISRTGCRAAGFVSHNTGLVESCTNRGCIIGDSGASGHGPAWGCAYNATAANFVENKGYGHVGDFAAFGANPAAAPDAMFYNAVVSPATNGFDTETNYVDETLDSYYDWTLAESADVCTGCKYSKYICSNVPRKVCVLEIDLTCSNINLTTSYSDDIVPNPNANKNSNNGPKVRETLSQLCARKRAEGRNIVAGINTGFFDSNDGISRGPHIEEGEPVYINNPSVRNRLPNHDWAFTVFTDGTASCGKKSFSGSTYGRAGQFKIGDREFNYYSVNDTICRNVSSSYPANLYTYRYVKEPHPSELPGTVNSLARDAYYLVCRFTGDPMKVNTGYADATITAIHDGRVSVLAEGPYVSGKDEFVLSLSGSTASDVSALASVGGSLQIRCDMSIDGSSKPIWTQNSTMFQLMVNGTDQSQSPPAGHSTIVTHDPLTFPVVSEDCRKVWLVEVDGRQDWVSMGVTSYEMFRIAKKLGGWNMTRFDGGGSSCMWVYASGKGAIVNNHTDSKGERSCLNYIIIENKL